MADLEQLKRRIDTRLNDYLVEMRPNYDDSMYGFNEAWDIVRKTFAEMAAADIEKANQGRPETVPDPKAPKPPNPALDNAIKPAKPGSPITRYDWQPLPPVGKEVMCMRDGEWMGAIGVWNGSRWESILAPTWYRDRDVLMPMKAPTHWKPV